VEHQPIDKSKDPVSVRLFKSNFLEFFTHISPVAILVLWVPVTALLLYFSIQTASMGMILGAFLLGLFLWTLGEYTLHRFLFHYPAKSEKSKKIFFLFHGVHHYQPQDKTRLVMPFPVSIPLALLFYGLFHLILGILLNAPQWINPLTAGFMVGYLIYDLTHYATHHFHMRRGYARYIKRYHMAHHYKDENSRYGVSSPIWDWVFNTAGK
jgi:sterol desaturase/sphingolipid hydroxylase (fatty acid hydroxylase superfamily)